MYNMTYSASEVNNVFEAYSTKDGRLKTISAYQPSCRTLYPNISGHRMVFNTLQKAQNIDIKTVDTANMNGNTVPITEN